MALQFSTGFKDSLLDGVGGGAVKTMFDDGTIRIYEGAVPADADAATSPATLIVEYSDAGQALAGGTGLDLAAAAADGAISKDSGQTWQGDAGQTATASFFRYEQQADTQVSSATQIRIQGTVGGAGADLFVASTSFINTQTYTIDLFSISIPTL
jgi:hypothetical protein